jgi:hypothetical protein
VSARPRGALDSEIDWIKRYVYDTNRGLLGGAMER